MKKITLIVFLICCLTLLFGCGSIPETPEAVSLVYYEHPMEEKTYYLPKSGAKVFTESLSRVDVYAIAGPPPKATATMAAS
jgi:hypothetical protein